MKFKTPLLIAIITLVFASCSSKKEVTEDKLGHFAQGFIPAMVAREIIIRKSIITIESWRNFFIICFCLGFSAFYELIEWWVALLSNEASNDFLGTQGYIWDTQSDMAWALFGAILALIVLSKYHDKQLKKI